MKHANAMGPESVLENIGWVRSLALHLAGHSIPADDVAQEIWVRVLRNPPPSGISFRQWTVGTMRRVMQEQARQSQRRRERELRVAKEREEERTLEISQQIDIERDVVQHVMELDEPYRSVVLARFFERKDVDELAAEEGVSASAIRSRLSRAYAKLRERMMERPETPAGAFLCMALGTSTKVAVGAAASKAGAPSVLKYALIGSGRLGALVLATVLIGLVGVAVMVMNQSRPGGSDELAGVGAARPSLAAPAAAEANAALAAVSRAKGAARSRAPEGAESSEAEPPEEGPAVAAPVEVIVAAEANQMVVRVLDRVGHVVEGVSIVARSPGVSRFSSRYWQGLSGPAGAPTVLSCDRFATPGNATGTEVELSIQHFGLSFEPLLVDTAALPSEPVDLVITEPFGSLLLGFVDESGEPLAEWVDVEVSPQGAGTITDPLAVHQLNTSCAPGSSALLMPVALGQLVKGRAMPRAGWVMDEWEFEGPAAEGRVQVGTVEFVHPVPTVAFSLSTPPGVAWPSSSRVTARFVPDQGAVPYLSLSLDERDDRHFVASVFPGSMAGQLGRLAVQVEPRPDRRTRTVASLRALEVSVPVQLPDLRERLDLGELIVQLPKPTASGRVVDAQGQPVSFAMISFLARGAVNGSEAWKRVNASRMVMADREGRFDVVPGAQTEAEAIMASHPVKGVSQPVLLEGNHGEIQIQLGAATSLRGRLLLPEGAEAEGMWVDVIGSDEPELLERSASVGPDGSFEIKSLSAGRVDLSLRPRLSTHPVAKLLGVSVPHNGADEDPRLAPWDLQDELQALDLRIELSTGEPVELATVMVEKQIHLAEGSDLRVILPKRDCEITVNHLGFRQFRGGTATLPEVIVLQPGLAVDLEVHAGAGTSEVVDGLLVSLYPTNTLTMEELAALEPARWLDEFSRCQWTDRVPIVQGGLTRLVCHGPGEFYLRFRQKAGDSSDREIPVEALPESLRDIRIMIRDTQDPQRFRFDWP